MLGKLLNLNYPQFWQHKSISSYILLPFSFLFKFAPWLRTLFVKPLKLPIFSICVGNATVGGAGKTQTVRLLRERLQQKNLKCLIVCKGYLGECNKNAFLKQGLEYDAGKYGDEPVMLAKEGDVAVVKNLELFIRCDKITNYDLIILDDGLQNPAIAANLNILVVDGLRGFGNNLVLPAGPLRTEISKILPKTDLSVVIGEDVYNCRNIINNNCFEAQIKVLSSPGRKSTKYYAFCGIGNPAKFSLSLKNAGFNVAKFKAFPDHYAYSPEEIEELLREAKENKYILITTEKDHVKLPQAVRQEIQYLNIHLEAEEFANYALNRIYEKVNQAA